MKPQQVSYSSQSLSRRVVTGDYQSMAVQQSNLRWQSMGTESVIVHGESDIGVLRNVRNVLMGLQEEFSIGGNKVIISGEKKDQFNKRLILLEGEIEGLMKRKIQYFERDEKGGTRTMDYTGLLNEKQTQIVQLQKKINNLEQRLRRASARQIELQNHITHLFSELKKKEEIILAKNQVILAQVAASNNLKETLNRIRRNIDNNKSRIGDLERTIFESVSFPEVGSFEIKSELLTKQGAMSRSKTYQSQPSDQKNKTQLLMMFRQFERLNNTTGITDADLERTLEGFLVGFKGTRIVESVNRSIQRRQMQDDYHRLQQQFTAAVSIYKNQLDKLRKDNPSIRIDLDSRLFEILREQKLNVFKLQGDIVHLQRFTERTIEVPVQDARTKHLMHMLAVQMKKFCSKYPKLLEQMDTRLTQFFQQQLIDIIEVDQLDRVIEIVKYVPHTVKVQNVYAYSSQKSRKIQFHLRVLVKALLEQLQKIRRKTGVVLEIDQGIIGMINQQIMGVVDVDDILKVFRVVPKIVEVEKIVQKIVERIVEVPQIVTVEKIVQKIVEVEKIKQVEKIVNVPMEVPQIVQTVVEKLVPIERIVQKIIQVPQIVDRIVQVIREVPKIVEVQKIVERIVEVEKIIEVERVVNHIAPQIQIVEVIVEKIVPTERIVKQIQQVQVIVQKVVQKIVEVPQIIEVEKIVEKIVPQIEYRNAKEIQNYIEIRHQVVDRIIQKPIPIIQTVQKIVEVPQIIEKIVQTTNTIRQPYEVQVIRQKLITQQRIVEVQRIVQKPVIMHKEVPKQVEKIVHIPIIHEMLKIVKQFIEKPVIQRIEHTQIKEVYLRDPLIVKQPKTIEVERIVNHYIEVPKPIKYIEQKIVEVIRYVDRIKQIKVPVQKIIEKMVQVPKVVEVQKIVQRIVVVPRVIEKIVQVVQFVERVVPKIMVEQRIKEVQKIVQVPVIQQRIVEVQVIKNVYIEVDRVVEKIVDKLVTVPQYEEKIINNEVIIQKVVQVIRQVPRNIQVQKIVHNYIEVPQIVEIERQIIVPIEVPIPVQKIIEKMVPMTETVEKIVQVPQIIEKIVTQKVEDIKIEQIVRYQDKVYIDRQIQEVVKEVPYIRTQIQQVEVIREKIVPIKSTVQQIKIAQQIVQKIVEKSTIVPKIYEVQRINEKVIEVPKIVQIEKIVPQLVNVNRYIQNIVEKIVQVPVIIQQIKQVMREHQKIIEVKNQYETVIEVQRVVEKAVIMEKFKEVVRNINHIEKVLQIVDRYEQIPVQIIAHEEKFVEVPYILEKIVEKIVIMPQIVEVLKYVHEVVEEQTLGVAITADVATHQQRYKLLTKDLKVNLDVLLVEIRKLKSQNPNLRIQIQIIQKFLSELQQFILFPRIVQVPKDRIVQKIVQKDRIVTLPTQDERSLKMELTLSLLVEKLILQLKRLKTQKPDLRLQLEDDVKLIFFSDLQGGSRLVGQEMNAKLRSFSDSIYRKFESLGSWSLDHQMMLNSFLQERFMMANLVKNANLEIQKSKNISAKRDQALKRYQSQCGVLQGYIDKIQSNITSMNIDVTTSSILNNIFNEFKTYKSTKISSQPMRFLDDMVINQERIASLLRQKDAEIIRLKDKIMGIQRMRSIGDRGDSYSKTLDIVQSENIRLKNEISALVQKQGSAQLVKSYQEQITSLNKRVWELEQEKSDLAAQLSNTRRQLQMIANLKSNDLKGSMLTKIEGSERKIYTPSYASGSPDKYGTSMSSPGYDIKMVESSYKQEGTHGPSSSIKQVSYGGKMDRSDYKQSGSFIRQQTQKSSYGVTEKDAQRRETVDRSSGLRDTGSFAVGGEVNRQSARSDRSFTSGTGGTSGVSGTSQYSTQRYTYGGQGQTGQTGQTGQSSYIQGGVSGQSGFSSQSGQLGQGQSGYLGQSGLSGQSGQTGQSGVTYGTGQYSRTFGTGQMNQSGTGQKTNQTGTGINPTGSSSSGSKFSSQFPSQYKYEKK